MEDFDRDDLGNIQPREQDVAQQRVATEFQRALDEAIFKYLNKKGVPQRPQYDAANPQEERINKRIFQLYLEEPGFARSHRLVEADVQLHCGFIVTKPYDRPRYGIELSFKGYILSMETMTFDHIAPEDYIMHAASIMLQKSVLNAEQALINIAISYLVDNEDDTGEENYALTVGQNAPD